MLGSPLEHFGFEIARLGAEFYVSPERIASEGMVATRAGPHLAEVPKGTRQLAWQVPLVDSAESQPFEQLWINQIPVDLPGVFLYESP